MPPTPPVRPRGTHRQRQLRWDVSPDKLRQLHELQRRRADQLAARRAAWIADPALWVRERLGEHTWSKQGEIMRAVAEHQLVSVQSSHGIGKSHLASRVVGWYLDTHEPGDVFVVTTAPTWHQVRAILWRYILQMHAKGTLPGYVTQQAEWKIGQELVAFGRKPADTDNQGMQGIHAPVGVLAVVDEGSGVPNQIFDAVDSLVVTDESRTLVIGNPDNVSSRFYSICTTEPGWHRIKVSSFDTPAFTGEPVHPSIKGLVKRSWVEDKKERWGERSPLYKIKVLGEFVEDDANALIPMSWVRAAIGRWNAWFDSDAHAQGEQPRGRRVLGVDVALQGEDLTAIATRQGDVVLQAIETWSGLDTIEIANKVQDRLKAAPQSTAVVDAIGVGAGVVDVLRHRGQPVQAFVASRKTKRRDATNTQGFNNLRSAAWWHLRELLDPALGATLALPDDDEMVIDLTAPRWEPVTGGKIVVEPTEDIVARIGRSPDRGTAVVQACWVEAPHRAPDAETPPALPKVRAYVDGVSGWD